MSRQEPVEHRREVRAGREEVLSAVAAEAERWGARWQPDAWGGRLELPVSAGLRRGSLRGRVDVTREEGRSRLVLRVDEARFAVHRSAAAVVGFGAAGGVVTVLWPFFPGLLALAPVGLVLAFVAWLLVASRLRMAGAEEFLAAVGEEAEQGRGEGPEG